jgi:site-specific DNA recombinase
MKIGIYCRVSSEEQKTRGVSIIDQEKRGIAFCEKNNFQYEVFNDAGLSGELPPDERPQLKKLLEQIYLEEIYGVFVVDFDRISRDEKFGFALKRILIQSKIKLFDANGEINLNDETQNLLLGIKILLSSFELDKLRVRIKRNLERSISEGNVGGGPLQAYGYMKGENKKLVINDAESEVVKLIFQLAIEGNGTKVIANTLNELKIPTKRGNSKQHMIVKGVRKDNFIWRDAVIYRILTSTIYIGQRLYKEKYYPAPSIIQTEKFVLVQQALKTRNQFKDTTNKYFYLLKGLVFCYACRNRFYGKKRADLSDNYYSCSSHRHKNEWCGTKGINIDYLDKLILDNVSKIEEDVNNFFKWYEEDDVNNNIKKELVEINKIEKGIKTKIDNLIDLGIGGSIKKDVFNNRMNKLNEELDETLKRKERVIKELNVIDKKEDVVRILKEHISTIKSTTDLNIKRELLRAILESVIVRWHQNNQKHSVIITYKIDKLSQFIIGKTIDLTYSKAGYRLNRNDVFDESLFIRKSLFDGEDLLGMPMVSIQ